MIFVDNIQIFTMQVFILFYLILVFIIKLSIKNIFLIYIYLSVVSLSYHIFFSISYINEYILTGLFVSICVNVGVYIWVRKYKIKINDQLVNKGDMKIFFNFVKSLFHRGKN